MQDKDIKMKMEIKTAAKKKTTEPKKAKASQRNVREIRESSVRGASQAVKGTKMQEKETGKEVYRGGRKFSITNSNNRKAENK
jgi:hypothetical protein